MKNLSEMYNEDNYTSLSEHLNESRQIDEGIKDVWNKVTDSIKKVADRVVDYVKAKVAQIGSLFMAIGPDGAVLSASTPMTAGKAYNDGAIDTSSTFVSLDRDASKIVGLKTKKADVLKLPAYRVKGLDYILMCESNTSNIANVNEVKLQHEDPDAIYNVIADNKDLVEEIKLHINNKSIAPLIIFGAPGIGKTAILEQVVKEMGDDYSLIVKTLSNETPDNFFLPTYVEKEADSKLQALIKTVGNIMMKKATDVPKTWLPVYKKTGNAKIDKFASDALGKGVLFIDELSRATSQVLNVCLPLLNEGRIGDGWYLGDGWTIIAASNRAEDDNDQSSLNTTMLSRLDQVYYEPTVKSWEDWAKTQGFISPLLLQWLNMPANEEFSGGKFFYYDPNESGERENDGGIICNPRTWTNAMRKLACYSHTGKLEGFDILDIPEQKMKRILNGFIPASVVDQFMGFLKIVRGVGDWDRAVESVWTNAGKGLNIKKDDLRRIQTILIQQIICAHAGTLPTEKEFDSLCQWIVNCKSEQLASYMIDTFKSVYGDNMSGDLVITFKYNYNGYTKELDKKLAVDEMAGVFSKYGYTKDTYPDYFTDGKGNEGGFTRLIDAYGDSFARYTVNGRAALG